MDDGQTLTRDRAIRSAERPVAPPPTGTAEEDLRCLTQIAAGNEEAVSQLYDRYSAKMYGTALFLARDPLDAEDVVIDVFMKVWRTASEYDAQRGTVSAWLTTMVRSRALDVVRARGRRERAHDLAGVQATIEADEGSSWSEALFQSWIMTNSRLDLPRR